MLPFFRKQENNNFNYQKTQNFVPTRKHKTFRHIFERRTKRMALVRLELRSTPAKIITLLHVCSYGIYGIANVDNNYLIIGLFVTDDLETINKINAETEVVATPFLQQLEWLQTTLDKSDELFELLLHVNTGDDVIREQWLHDGCDNCSS